jgi:hypothetical protein
MEAIRLVCRFRCAKQTRRIRVDDAQEILKSLSLKSYEGGYKIMIIWMADKLNIAASNKLLNYWKNRQKRRFSFNFRKRRRFHSNHSFSLPSLHFNG